MRFTFRRLSCAGRALYLKGTMNLALFYLTNTTKEVRDLLAFSDADLAGESLNFRYIKEIAGLQEESDRDIKMF